MSGIKFSFLKIFVLYKIKNCFCLFEVTDAVEDVLTPFEHRNFSLTDKYYGAYYEFAVAFGFSKSGWKELKKTMIAKDNKQKE